MLGERSNRPFARSGFAVRRRQDAPLAVRQDGSGSATGSPSTEGTATEAGSAATTAGTGTATATGTDAASGTPTDSGSQQGSVTNTDASSNTATETSVNTPADTSSNSATDTQNTQNSPTSTQTSPTSTPPPTTDTTSTPTSTETSTTPTLTPTRTQTTSTTTTDTSATTSTTSTTQTMSTPTRTTSSTTSQTSSSTTPPPTPSSSSATGRVSTIGTSTVVTSVNGQLTTSLEPIVTTLGESDSGGLSPAANKGIIAGSVVGVFALLVLAFAMVVFYRRHRHKKLDFFKWPQPKPRSMLLAGEDLDDVDMGPPMAGYRDYPTSVASHSAAPSRAGQYSPTHYRDNAGSGSINGPPMDPNASSSQSRVNVGGGMSSPHLMGMRTSEAGSLFQEEVWPPPRKPFVDPLVSTEDLSHIVDDVMGPRDPNTTANSSGQPSADSRLRGGRASVSSLESAPDSGDRHARSASQTTLLPPASPREETKRTPLFVTNLAGTDTPSIYSQQSPPLRPSRHLSSGTLGEPMGEAL